MSMQFGALNPQPPFAVRPTNGTGCPMIRATCEADTGQPDADDAVAKLDEMSPLGDELWFGEVAASCPVGRPSVLVPPNAGITGLPATVLDTWSEGFDDEHAVSTAPQDATPIITLSAVAADLRKSLTWSSYTK